MTLFDADAARSWLRILHGDAPGLVHVCATGNWDGATFRNDQLDAATAYAAVLDAAKPEGVYVRVTTLASPPIKGRRGGVDISHAIPALWADLDLAGPGHKSTEKLPPDETSAQAIIAAAGLPDATIWIHSGGGLYPIWLLDTPHVITDDLADVVDLASNWQKIIGHASTALGWHYGTGVGDLARVLRLPGTVNRKAGLERACRVIGGSGTRYSYEALSRAVADALALIPEPEPPRLSVVRVDDGSTSPGDDYTNRTDWADILTPAGWRYAYSRGQTRYWRRPGKDTAGISATTNALGTDRLHIFTTSTEFEVGSHSKLGAYATIHHSGDLKAAAKALKDQGYGKPVPLSQDPAAAQREMIGDLINQPADNMPNSIPLTLTVVDGTAARVVVAEPLPAPERYGATEDGMARALVAHHHHELRYCPQRGNWLTWTGHVWAWDDGETHREKIRSLARELPETDSWRTFKKRALSAAGVAGIARLAQSDTRIVVNFTDLDNHSWDLNTPIGIVDLRTGRLRASDPAKLHTRTTTVAPDPAADATMWLLFLSQTFGNNADLVSYLQRLVGYSATANTGAHVLPFAFGSGGNGKGVFLEAIAAVLGDYATTAPVGFLMAQLHSSHETEIARLAGTRLVLCSEVNEGDRFDEAKVKQLTGGDTLTARFMRQDHFSFKPTHQLWLMGNHKPEVKSGGRAFWRRLRLIPFLYEVPEDRINEELQSILVRDYGPAIMAWIVAGATAYANGGLRDPDSVKAATAEYEKEQDTVTRFVEDCCIVGASDAVKIKMAIVWTAYERWCTTGGETPTTRKAFGLTLKTRFGVGEERTASARFYVGMTLMTDPSAESSESSSGQERYR